MASFDVDLVSVQHYTLVTKHHLISPVQPIVHKFNPEVLRKTTLIDLVVMRPSLVVSIVDHNSDLMRLYDPMETLGVLLHVDALVDVVILDVPRKAMLQTSLLVDCGDVLVSRTFFSVWTVPLAESVASFDGGLDV